jgi:uncharacterized damage-inducible protein DinB
MEHLQRLATYTVWANRSWLDFVYGSAPTDEYLTRLVSHLYLAEQAWFQRIRGQDVNKEVFKTRAKEELLALATLHPQRYADVLAGDLDLVLKYRRFNGDEYESSLGDIVLHLFTHGSHHRGQLATYASQKSLGAPVTDFITYSRAQKG